jgi:hypothetical protein
MTSLLHQVPDDRKNKKKKHASDTFSDDFPLAPFLFGSNKIIEKQLNLYQRT